MIILKKLLIIDGNSIVNRAFFAIKALSDKNGMYTNGIFGFLNIYFKHTEELKPDFVAVAFDLKAPTFRHKKYAQYKAQRKGMPDELKMQMPVLKEILRAMNVAIYEKEGYEADDIIGTVSRICDEEKTQCYILTGDKDDLQLASANTKILLTVTRMGVTDTTVMDDKAVKQKYGVTPTEFIDVKGLMGDTSDNVPGVKGIGEKSAFAYIQKFSSIENLYNNIDDEIIKPAARKKLADGKDMAYLSKELCTIDRNVPMDFNIEDTAVKPYNTEVLTQLFKNLGFKTFLKKLGADSTSDALKCDRKFEYTDDAASLKDILKTTKDSFVYKIFYSGKKGAFQSAIHSLCFTDGKKIYYAKCSLLMTEDDIAECIKPVFENDKIIKISDNIKADIVNLNAYGICLDTSYFDTSVAAYIIDPSRSGYEISGIARQFTDIDIADEKSIFGTGKSAKTVDEIDGRTLEKYITEQLCAIELLKEYEEKTITEREQQKLLYDIELPLTHVLAQMEIEGFTVNSAQLESFSKMLKTRISDIEKQIYDYAGEIFNISSTKQLGVILFEKMGLRVIKKTKTGYSTDADVLEKLKSAHPIIECIIEYRTLTKLKSTYADGLLSVICSDGKIHSKFNQTVTVTGRISSTEPNLQNIPARTELGREIRKMFTAKDGCILTDADYSQIELRVLAHAANDETMINAFLSGEDIHKSTAASIFGVDKEDVTSVMRSHAKTINFGIIYGMGDFSLAQDLHITKKEAKAYIESYFEKFSSVRRYMDSTVENAKKDGFVTTLFGRRRYIAELSSSNHMVRAFGERAAMNTPIQGSAADIIKIAMVAVSRELKRQNLKSKLILQVHDELIIETYEDETERVKQILTECMQNAAHLNVPLVAEANTGKTWYDAK